MVYTCKGKKYEMLNMFVKNLPIHSNDNGAHTDLERRLENYFELYFEKSNTMNVVYGAFCGLSRSDLKNKESQDGYFYLYPPKNIDLYSGTRELFSQLNSNIFGTILGSLGINREFLRLYRYVLNAQMKPDEKFHLNSILFKTVNKHRQISIMRAVEIASRYDLLLGKVSYFEDIGDQFNFYYQSMFSQDFDFFDHTLPKNLVDNIMQNLRKRQNCLGDGIATIKSAM